MGPASRAAVERAVVLAHTEEWAYVLAATARVAADLDIAEDCVQEAYAQALVHWPVQGIPRRPGGWLTTVATRRALEQRRRRATLTRKLALLVPDEVSGDRSPEVFPDDRLRLVFTCCHPALARETQVALTLRLVCGLSSVEVAKALLVKETTMQARLTRAKRKISDTSIPYRVPHAADLAERTDAVLEVVHLVYSAGHTAPVGTTLTRADLAGRGSDLARMMRLLIPASSEVAGLLGLVLLSESRHDARLDDAGRLVLMEDQDRGRWDRALIAEGLTLVEEAVAAVPVGRFALMAAIAAVHVEASCWAETDWHQMLGLYDLLLLRWPSPVVALNRVVALSYVEGPQRALTALEMLDRDPGLAAYPYLAATRADLLRRTGDADGAAAAYEEAALLTANAVEAEFLLRRRERLGRAES